MEATVDIFSSRLLFFFYTITSYLYFIFFRSFVSVPTKWVNFVKIQVYNKLIILDMHR